MSEQLRRKRINATGSENDSGVTYVTGCERHFLLNPIIHRRSVAVPYTCLLNMHAVITIHETNVVLNNKPVALKSPVALQLYATLKQNFRSRFITVAIRSIMYSTDRLINIGLINLFKRKDLKSRAIKIKNKYVFLQIKFNLRNLSIK